MPPERKAPPRSPTHAALGQAIEVLVAENAEIDKDTVCRRSGLDEKQLGGLMRGTSNPTFETLLRLCEGLGVRIGVLMTKADELEDKRKKRS
jgi:transcriptional regulator with XRE-family HTH domain